MRQRSDRRKQGKKHLVRLGALIAAGTAAGTASAATITVNSTADTVATDAQCTLREAIANANADSETTGGDCVAGSGADTIQFSLPNPSTITLGGSQLSISDSLTINGPGVAALTISGNNASRVFYVGNNSQALTVTISALSMPQGADTGGSAILDKGEALTLDTVTITGNTGNAIVVQPGGSISLSHSTVTGTITGRGMFANHPTTVTITDTTVSNNNTASKGGGIFLYRVSGQTTIDQSTFSGNVSGSRGGGMALYNMEGPVMITNTQVTGNTSANRGAGIFLYKPLDDVTIADTVISGNTASNRGGGLFFYKQTVGKTLTIRNSTISGNQANGGLGDGGGIFFYKQAGATILENSTISGNTSGARGGAIYDHNILGGTLTIRNSTINGNTAAVDGGNLHLASFPSVTITSSIVANGTAPSSPDLLTAASNVTANYSLIENTSGATFGGANNITGVDPQLGPLANNGGPTQTHVPAATSPVINAGDPAFTPPPATDQRGQARVANGRIDIGSVESIGGVIGFSSATYSIAENGGSVTVTLTRTGADPATVNYATSNGSATSPADYSATSGTASFAAGATSTTFSVTINDDAIYEGNETFNLTLSSPSPNASLGLSTAVVTIVENDPGNADVGITKTAAGSLFIAGQPMTFHLTVSNSGPTNANSVVVTDTIPAGTTFVSAIPSQGSCAGTTVVTCNLGLVNNGGNATIALTVTPAASGPISNTATVSAAPQPDPNPANNSATANVTVVGATAVPALGDLAKIAMAAMALAIGLFVMKRD
ncbi:MAG: DUF11 domain-containing protein [Acidobacteria bacterium]|nr:DUF11 domain-containing protein [Acidobacteriota bacterium]